MLEIDKNRSISGLSKGFFMAEKEDIKGKESKPVSSSPRANEEEIKNSIISVMKKYKKVKSQEDLAFLAVKELRKKYPFCLLSSQRARAIALGTAGISVKVLTKKSSKQKPENCPACKSKLKGLYAINLSNKKVLVGLECDKCNYKGTLQSFAPFRYEFYLKK